MVDGPTFDALVRGAVQYAPCVMGTLGGTLVVGVYLWNKAGGYLRPIQPDKESAEPYEVNWGAGADHALNHPFGSNEKK